MNQRIEVRPLLHVVGLSFALFACLLACQPIDLALTFSLALPITVRLEGLDSDRLRGVSVSRVSPRGRVLPLAWNSRHDRWEASGAWARRIRVDVPKVAWESVRGIAVGVGTRAIESTREEVDREWLTVASSPDRVVLELPAGRAFPTGGLSPARFLLNWPDVSAHPVDLWHWPAIFSGLFLLLSLAVREMTRHPLAARVLGLVLGPDGPASRARTGETPDLVPSPRSGCSEVLADPNSSGSLRQVPPPLDPPPSTLDPQPSTPHSSGPLAGTSAASPAAWMGAGMLVLVTALTILETLDPCYFSAADNVVYVLPGMLEARHALASGRLPLWSPSYLLGSPTAEAGVLALTYPFTYLAAWAAEHFLGSEFLLLEVLAWFHLLAGYLAVFWLGRSVGLRPALASSASLASVLCGFNVVAGRSWYNMLPYVWSTPLLLLAAHRLGQTAPRRRWIVATGLVVGLSFHAGNAQMWLYSVLFMAFVVMLGFVSGETPAARVVPLALAMALGAGIAAPLLVPQLSLASSGNRIGGQGDGVLRGLAAMLLPAPLVRPAPPNGWGGRRFDELGTIYWMGPLPAGVGVAGFALLLGGLGGTRGLRRRLGPGAWLLGGGLALLLAIGRPAGLWLVMSVLPVLSKLTQPVKFLPFAALFFSIGGALILERWLPAGRRGAAVFALTAALALQQATICPPSLYDYGFRLFPPLPGLATGQQAILNSNHRFYPLTPVFHVSGDYHWSLPYNLSAIYGLSSFDGYDPLVQSSAENCRVADAFARDPLATLRTYGVRWVLEHRVLTRPELSPNPEMWPREMPPAAMLSLLAQLRASGSRRTPVGPVIVWELADPCPLAFVEARPAVALPAKFHSEGADVELAIADRSETLVVNVLLRRGMSGSADGVRVTLEPDAFGRVRAALPPGARHFSLRYDAPWTTGLLVGALILAGVLLGSILAVANTAHLGREIGYHLPPGQSALPRHRDRHRDCAEH